MFFVYVLQCRRTFGIILVLRRIWSTNEKYNSGERNSHKWNTLEVDSHEEFETRAEAIKKEKQIKSRGARRYLDDIKPG